MCIRDRNCTTPSRPSSTSAWFHPTSVPRSQPSASDCIHVPVTEISWPKKKSRKLRWWRARPAAANRTRPPTITARPRAPAPPVHPRQRASGALRASATRTRRPGSGAGRRDSSPFGRSRLIDPRGGSVPTAPGLVHHGLESTDLALEGLDLALEAGDALALDPPTLGRIGRGMERGMAPLPRCLILEQLGNLREREARIVAQTFDEAQALQVGLVEEAIVTLGTGSRPKQSDLFVVAHGSGCQPGLRRGLVDVQEPVSRGASLVRGGHERILSPPCRLRECRPRVTSALVVLARGVDGQAYL